ncbi:MAG: TIGR02611 family protein [Corynebacteriales bacterium]|nr:TIGR02611 family protein [Mycobacteriales bacterium]
MNATDLTAESGRQPAPPVSPAPKQRHHIPDAFDRTHDDDTVLEVVADRLGFLDRIRAHPILGWMYRAGVAVVGGAVVLAGLVLIPAPGPGWLIVFAGLGILATEFAWAQRLLQYAKAKVSLWTNWIMAKPLWIRGVIGLGGSAALSGFFLYTLYLSGWRGVPFSWLS